MNIDKETVDGFGREWSHYDFSSEGDLQNAFGEYFSLFPWSRLPPGARGFDLGCGTGRWARFVAPKVGELVCLDASAQAVAVARRNLRALPNCKVLEARVDNMPLADASMDFGYSLGVLHHVPDTQAGLNACVRKLKPGAPFLLYLYYALENRSAAYRALWRVSDFARRQISGLPFAARLAVTQTIATTVYWPLARTAQLAERIGLSVERVPLSYYRDKSFYVMRTDALDRFGTRLEQRFTRHQIAEMMRAAGLIDVVFREATPYWCAVGSKA